MERWRVSEITRTFLRVTRSSQGCSGPYGESVAFQVARSALRRTAHLLAATDQLTRFECSVPDSRRGKQTRLDNNKVKGWGAFSVLYVYIKIYNNIYVRTNNRSPRRRSSITNTHTILLLSQCRCVVQIMYLLVYWRAESRRTGRGPSARAKKKTVCRQAPSPMRTDDNEGWIIAV